MASTMSFIKYPVKISFWKHSELWGCVLQTSFSSTIMLQLEEMMLCILNSMCKDGLNYK